MPAGDVFSTIPTKILVPVDFSPSSHAALESAADLAQHFAAALHLVHVVPMFPSSTLPDYISESKFTDGAKAEAERLFAAAIADLTSRGIKVSSSVEVGEDVPLRSSKLSSKIRPIWWSSPHTGSLGGTRLCSDRLPRRS